jgi:hypothetical protein
MIMRTACNVVGGMKGGGLATPDARAAVVAMVDSAMMVSCMSDADVPAG